MNGRYAQQEQADLALRVRIGVIGLLLSFGFVVIVFRSVQIQLENHPHLDGVAEQQYQAVIPVARKRAKILDARERDLAVNIPVQSIFADPTAVVDPEATLDAIAGITELGAKRSVLLRRLRSNKQFAWMVRRVLPEVAEQVKALNLPGVHFLEESRRVYPNGSLASQVLGAVGYDSEALAGLELHYDHHLTDESPDVVYQRDARGRFFFTPVAQQRAQEVPVGNVVLTIDKIIQYAAEKALSHAVEKAQAKSGVAVAVDVQTGRILAMANVPTFDPNHYSNFPQEAWRNRVVTDAYEPGSTLKVMLVAEAMKRGMKAKRRFDCENGKYRVHRAVINDTKPHGKISVSDIIQVSSNIGAVKIAEEIGRDALGTALADFGFAKKTELDFPGESSGMLRAVNKWHPVEMANIAFGQGMTATPLQVAMAFAAIANGGQLMRPYLLDRVVSDDGAVLLQQQPQLVRQVASPEVASALTQMLERVVQEGGTGLQAASRLYRIAGKTGTAQKVAVGSRGYAEGKYYSSFVGFAPAARPQIAVFVGLDEPVGSYYGGAVAGPVVREVLESALQYLEVPTENAPIILASKARGGVSPRASSVEFHVQSGGAVVVPRLTGLSMRQVLRLAREANVPLSVSGLGVAVKQRPSAGTLLADGRAVEVQFQLPE